MSLNEFTEEEYKSVEASFGRCSVIKEFIDTFYDSFLKSDSSIAPYFKDTDFTEQKKALQFGISNLVMYAKDPNSAYIKGKLDKLAEKHDRNHLSIPKELYTYWLSSLSEAVKKCDKDCSPELDSAWNKVLSVGIHHIKNAY